MTLAQHRFLSFFFLLSILLLFSSQIVYGQSDAKDTLVFRNERSIIGKVIDSKPASIEFKDSMRDSVLSFKKAEIKEIRFSSGMVINYEQKEPDLTFVGPAIMLAASAALLIWTLTQLP